MRKGKFLWFSSRIKKGRRMIDDPRKSDDWQNQSSPQGIS